MWDPWPSKYFTFFHFGELHNYIPQMMWQDTMIHVTLGMTLDNDDIEVHDDMEFPICSSCCLVFNIRERFIQYFISIKDMFYSPFSPSKWLNGVFNMIFIF